MIWRSKFPDVPIPDVPLHEYVLGPAPRHGDRPALVDGPTGRTITFAQLAAMARRMAHGLARRGFRPGDVLAILLPNLPEYAVAFYGTIAAGGVVTTVSPLATEDDLAHQLRDAGARMLLTVEPFLGRAVAAAHRAGLSEVFVLGHGDGATPFAELLAEDGPLPPFGRSPRDLVVLPYSSGTTGLPKGVMLTHRNLVANCEQSAVLQRLGTDDRLIAVLPFFHIYGMTVLLNLGLSRGATLVTMPRFELEPFLGLCEKHRVTRLYVAPPIVLALARHEAVARHDLSSVRGVISGAAPLEADLQEACAARLGCVVGQGYGMTESSPVTHIGSDQPGVTRAGAVGALVPNTEMRLVSPETGLDAAPGEPGEVWIRGPQVMQGYLNNPAATAATLDADGWLHTGDIGVVDDHEDLRIVDRMKELIKYKGYQVPPAELEGVLRTHPAVADAAVVPMPDAEAGEVPLAFVVTRGPVTDHELMDYVGLRVAPYKRIRAVEFIDAIPKSASGKILRRVLRDRGHHNGPPSAP